MFDHSKLTIYLRYAGSVDFWERSGTTHDKRAITYKEWLVIDQYSESLRLATLHAISADEFALQEASIKSACESAGIFLRLKEIAEKKGGNKPKRTYLDSMLSWFLG